MLSSFLSSNIFRLYYCTIVLPVLVVLSQA